MKYSWYGCATAPNRLLNWESPADSPDSPMWYLPQLAWQAAAIATLCSSRFAWVCEASSSSIAPRV
jgi:hypothetical protein